MIVKSQKYIYFLMGGIMLIPVLSHPILGSNLPYLQIFLISILLVMYVLRHKKYPINLIDQMVIIYVFWILISCILSAIFTPAQNLHRIISFIVSLGIISPYVISRNYFRKSQYLKYFLWGIVFIYSIFFIYWIYRYISLGLDNFMAARVILHQRLPLLICFVITVGLYYSFVTYNKKLRFYLYGFYFTGGILILFSLTRASYLQLIIGIVSIFLFSKKEKKLVIIKLSIMFIVCVFFLSSSLNLINTKNITKRFNDILNYSSIGRYDASAANRLIMWAELEKKLTQQPLRLIIGYGQLGPSYVGNPTKSFTGSSLKLYSAHNEYLDMLIRNGVLGLFIFALIYFMAIYSGFKIKRRLSEEVRNFFIGHSFGLLGVLVYGFFHETIRYFIFGMYFWFYLGIVSALLYSDGEKNFVI